MRNSAAKIGVVDVETTRIEPGKRPRTKFWGTAIEGEGYRRFETSYDLIRFLSGRSDKLRFYHHHDFDPCQLIVDGFFPQNLKMRGARIIRSVVAGTDWVNSYALFPDGLAKILDACGYQKLPLGCDRHFPHGTKVCKCHGEPNHARGTDECAECLDRLGERNVSDCMDALSAFSSLGIDYASATTIDPVRDDYTTAASAAFAAAEISAGKFPVDLRWHEAFRGGRTEAFRVMEDLYGRKISAPVQTKDWDINSSYPFAFVDLPDGDWLWHARVKVKNEDAPRPFFANGPREAGLKFPAGRFDTWFYGSNYERYIQPHGGIEDIQKIEKVWVDFSWLKRCVPMIRRLYKDRIEGPKGMRYVRKIQLNSLWGRMGMKPGGSQAFAATTAPESGTHFRIAPNSFLCFKSVYRKPKANYALAAAITDNGRARGYDGMMRAGSALYFDTDGMYLPSHITPTGIRIHESELGAWKNEHEGPMMIRTVKDYEFAGESKRKGGGKSSLWTVRLALGKKPVRAVNRQRKTEYDKRRVRRDGTTAPLIY